MFVVYILYSKKYNKIYIGYTSNLIVRFHSHNSLGIKGWTKKYRPWIVVYVEFFNSKQDAMQREKKLKQANSRSKIRTWISENY